MAQPQREWYEKDYYKILKVGEGATDKEITKAYRKLAKENHPDSHPGREEKFKEISAAYAVLSDPDKRTSYDEVHKLGPVGGFGGQGGGFGVRMDDLNDLFGGIFNAGGTPGSGRRGRFGGGVRNRQAGPRRGEDLEASLTLAFRDAVDGATTVLNLMGDAPCETCDATGAAPGTSPVICSACGGRGVIDSNQGFFSFSQPCTTCGGAGMRVEKPCPDCRGSGTARRAREVKVRVPAGVEDGQRIRLKGRGGAGQNGGPPGDLYVTVRVSGHELFGRKARDLTLAVPITFAEAALGATITVPTLDGPVSLRIPAGTPAGRTFRVKGRGAKAAGGAGDLLVSVDVAVPPQLNDEERAAVEALAKAGAGTNVRGHLGV